MKLIFNGDDFGICRSCNYGIIDCFKLGVLRSTSIMMNMPAVDHAIDLWKENPELSVGVHFNLTVGKPLTEAKTLIKEDGTFNKGNLKDSSNVDIDDIRKELQAQYDLFVEKTGMKPHHFNSHHGICLIKGGAEVLVEMANRYDLPIRQMWIMKDSDEYPGLNHKTTKMAMVMKIDGLSTKAEDILTYFTPEQLSSNEIYEIAGHPGYVDTDIMSLSSLTNGRCFDAKFMMSPIVKKFVEDNKIELVDYRELLK